MLLQVLLLLAVVFAIRYVKGKYPAPGLSLKSLVGLTLHCGVIAFAAGAYIYDLKSLLPEMYNDFIGGFVPMYARAKSFEYEAFYDGLGIFILLLLYMQFICSAWKKADREEDMQKIIFYSLIPSALMAGQMMVCKSIMLLVVPAAVSAIFGSVVLIFCRPQLENSDRMPPFVLLGSLYLLTASLYCVGLAENYFNIRGGMVVLMIIWLTTLYFAVKHSKWHCITVSSQLGLPLGFLHLAGVRLRLNNGTLFDPGFNAIPVVAVAILILAGYFAIFYKCRKKQTGFQDYVSGIAVLAFISCFCATRAAWPWILADDYHCGENFLPWYLLVEQGKLPYIGYIPSRGMVNYLAGFLIWLFKGHDFSLLNDMFKWADLPLYALLFWMLRRQCGLIVAVIGVSAVTDITPGMLAGTAAGIAGWYFLTSERFDGQPVKFLVWYGILSFCGFLYSLTDSLVVFVAMAPLVVYTVTAGWKQQKKYLLAAAGIFCAAGAVLLAIPVVRQMILEALNVLFAQSKVYTAAHCLPYMPELNTSPITQGVLWDCLRYLFIGFGALFGATLILMPESLHRQPRKFFSYSALAILMIIMIQRAGGRIDPNNYSRIYFVSSFVLCCVVPLWYVQVVGKKHHLHLVLCTLWLFGVGLFGKQTECLFNLGDKYLCEINAPENLVNPTESGLPHLGSCTVLDKEHFKHHLDIKVFRETILYPGEKIWDLTNNSTVYAYHDLPLAMRYPAYFYIAPPDLCRQIAGEIATDLPVLALIDGRNVEFNEGKLPLRAYALYSLLLDNYRVFQDINGKTWMIRKGEEKRLANNPLVKPGTLDDIELLCNALCDKVLYSYPMSWGESLNRLRDKLTPVANLDPAVAHYGVKRILFPVEELRGDIMVLRFDRMIPTGSLRVAWEDDFGGKGRFYSDFRSDGTDFVIPMSAFPNWYLSRKRKNLQIIFPAMPDPCPRVVECSFWNRK